MPIKKDVTILQRKCNIFQSKIIPSFSLSTFHLVGICLSKAIVLTQPIKPSWFCLQDFFLTSGQMVFRSLHCAVIYRATGKILCMIDVCPTAWLHIQYQDVWLYDVKLSTSLSIWRHCAACLGYLKNNQPPSLVFAGCNDKFVIGTFLLWS